MPEDVYLTLEQAEKLFRIGKPKLERLINENKLKTYEIDGGPKLKQGDIFDFIEVNPSILELDKEVELIEEITPNAPEAVMEVTPKPTEEPIEYEPKIILPKTKSLLTPPKQQSTKPPGPLLMTGAKPPVIQPRQTIEPVEIKEVSIEEINAEKEPVKIEQIEEVLHTPLPKQTPLLKRPLLKVEPSKATPSRPLLIPSAKKPKTSEIAETEFAQKLEDPTPIEPVPMEPQVLGKSTPPPVLPVIEKVEKTKKPGEITEEVKEEAQVKPKEAKRKLFGKSAPEPAPATPPPVSREPVEEKENLAEVAIPQKQVVKSTGWFFTIMFAFSMLIFGVAIYVQFAQMLNLSVPDFLQRVFELVK